MMYARRRLIKVALVILTVIAAFIFVLWITGDRENIVPNTVRSMHGVIATKTVEDIEFEAAQKAGTRVAWIDYLKRFPTGHYKSEARKFIHDLEEQAGLCVAGKTLKISSPMANVPYTEGEGRLTHADGTPVTSNAEGGEIITVIGSGLLSGFAPGNCIVEFKAPSGTILRFTMPTSNLQFPDTPTEAEINFAHKSLKGSPTVFVARMRELLAEKAAELGEKPEDFEKEMAFIEAHVKKCTNITPAEVSAGMTQYGFFDWRKIGGDKANCGASPVSVSQIVRDPKPNPGDRGIWFEAYNREGEAKQGIYKIRVMFTLRKGDHMMGTDPFDNHGIINAIVTRE